MQIERKWYFELFEFLIVMVILGCMCRIVWIDIYVCFKKKTYKQCSLYLYLVKLKFCEDSVNNEEADPEDTRPVPLRVRGSGRGGSRGRRGRAAEADVLPPGEGPPPYDLFSVDVTPHQGGITPAQGGSTPAQATVLITRPRRSGGHSLAAEEVVIRLPDEEGPPPYEEVPHIEGTSGPVPPIEGACGTASYLGGACGTDTHLTTDHSSPPEVIPLCTADNPTSGEHDSFPAEPDGRSSPPPPPPYIVVPTWESQPSQSLLPTANKNIHKHNRHAQNNSKPKEHTSLRLATISEDYDPQEGPSCSQVLPPSHGGASKRLQHPTTRGRSSMRSSQDVEWYHYSVI